MKSPITIKNAMTSRLTAYARRLSSTKIAFFGINIIACNPKKAIKMRFGPIKIVMSLAIFHINLQTDG